MNHRRHRQQRRSRRPGQIHKQDMADLQKTNNDASAAATPNSAAIVDRIAVHHWDELLGQWAVQKLKNGEMKILDIATPMFERTLINAALQQTRGRKRHAAELLGWGRNTLTRKLKELGMDSTEDDEDEEVRSA